MLAGNLVDVDRAGAEDALLALVAEGAATREALGDDAIWRACLSSARLARSGAVPLRPKAAIREVS